MPVISKWESSLSSESYLEPGRWPTCFQIAQHWSLNTSNERWQKQMNIHGRAVKTCRAIITWHRQPLSKLGNDKTMPCGFYQLKCIYVMLFEWFDGTFRAKSLGRTYLFECFISWTVWYYANHIQNKPAFCAPSLHKRSMLGEIELLCNGWASYSQFIQGISFPILVCCVMLEWGWWSNNATIWDLAYPPM